MTEPSLNLSVCDENTEHIVFDAIRDNKGRGIKSQDLLKILQKIDTGEIIIDSVRIKNEKTYKNI